MTHGSLFSGIGGFDLAAQWAGWDNAFHCELNPFGRQVLHHYWPEAVSYENIKTTDFSIWRNRIDVLSGGFPCQPYSVAGKRLGTADDRHLWPEMLRAIREIAPRWVVGENVHGLVSWSGGLVFEEVQTDLEGLGYEVQPYILPAAGVGATHERYRTWFVAYANNQGLQGRQNKRGFEKSGQKRNKQPAGLLRPNWQNFPTQSPIRSRNDGIPAGLVGITIPKHRNESIKAYGNAIVPQVAFQIFTAINQYENLKK